MKNKEQESRISGRAAVKQPWRSGGGGAEYILPVDIYRMLSRYYSSPPGGSGEMAATSHNCATVGRVLTAAAAAMRGRARGREGGEGARSSILLRDVRMI